MDDPRARERDQRVELRLGLVASCECVGGAGSPSGRQPHTRWNLTRVDQLADLGRPARVEVDVALADATASRPAAPPPAAPPPPPAPARGRCRRSRAGGGRTRCGAAPLAHPVEPLEDPAGRAQAGIGVLVRARDVAAGAEQVEHGVLDLVVAAGRVPAEARDGLGDPQRVAGADRLAQRDVVDHPWRQRAAHSRAAGRSAPPARRSRARRTPARSARRGRRARGSRRRARPRAAADRRARGRAGLGELDQRAHDGGGQQPLALGDDVGIGAQRGGHRDRGDEVAAWARSRPPPARPCPSAAWRARRGRCAAPPRGPRAGVRRPRAGQPRRRRRRARPPRPSSLYRIGMATSADGSSRMVVCRASSSVTRRAGRRSGGGCPGGRATRAEGRSRACSRARPRRSRRCSTSCAAGPGTPRSRGRRDRGAARRPLRLRPERRGP